MITNQENIPLVHEVLIFKIAEVWNLNGGIRLSCVWHVEACHVGSICTHLAAIYIDTPIEKHHDSHALIGV